MSTHRLMQALKVQVPRQARAHALHLGQRHRAALDHRRQRLAVHEIQDQVRRAVVLALVAQAHDRWMVEPLTAWASSSKRRRSLVVALRSNFTATGSPTARSSARYTSATPPRPSIGPSR